jgi:hypothetical protein
MILTTIAPLLSMFAVYLFAVALAFFLPLFQTIALLKISSAKIPWIWMLHFPYFIIFILYEPTKFIGFIALFGVSILGQVLLYFIFGSFGKFQWLLFNSLNIVVIILAAWVSSEIRISNDFLQIVFIIGFVFLSSFITGKGIIRGYLSEG